MQSETNKVIASFKGLENQVAEGGNLTVKQRMLIVFKEYKNTPFKQGDFAKRLGKRTQHINHMLAELRKDGLIIREGTRRQYYYRLA